jgi:hypothetical protein
MNSAAPPMASNAKAEGTSTGVAKNPDSASLCRDGLCDWFGLRERRPLPFVFAQRWQFHFGLAGVGTMNRFAIVSKGFPPGSTTSFGLTLQE